MISIVYFGLQATYNKAACIIYSDLCHITHGKSSSYPYHLLY